MCRPVPDLLPLDIDEELVSFLSCTEVRDSIPSNLIIGVNPFCLEPWVSAENMLYWYSTCNPQPHKGEDEIKVTQVGYWKTMGHDLSILASASAVGKRITHNFYVGKAPFGDKTRWMMHEYQAEHKARQGNHVVQVYSSLCRFFQQSDERRDVLEQQNPEDACCVEDDDGEFIEAVLLSLLEEEEHNCALQDAANMTQTVGGDPLPDDSAENMLVACDFSKEDYLELNDLCSVDSSSSSSDGFDLISLNSDEYFDADALLRDLESECHDQEDEAQR